MALLLHDIEAFLCSLKGVTYIVKVTTLLAAATALAASLDTMIRHTILDDATLSSSHLLPTYIDTFSKISAFDVDYKNTFHVQRAHSKTVLAKFWYFSNTYLLTTVVAQN